jgi:F-box-like
MFEIYGRDTATMKDKAKRRRLNAVLVIDWSSLPEELFPSILSHLDVKTLIQKKQVCRIWRDTCTKAVDAKQTSTTRKAFSTNKELREAVKKYCGFNEATKSYSPYNPQDAEEIAQTYGYPILTSGMFQTCKTFLGSSAV